MSINSFNNSKSFIFKEKPCIRLAHTIKGEFDSIKFDFASQISDYENSIDSKIDGAIAQYLGGSRIYESGECLYDKVKKMLGDGFRWHNSWVGKGDSSIDTILDITVTREYYTKQYATFIEKLVQFIYGSSTGSNGNIQSRIFNEKDVFVAYAAGSGAPVKVGDAELEAWITWPNNYIVFTDAANKSSWTSCSTANVLYNDSKNVFSGSAKTVWLLTTDYSGRRSLSLFYEVYAPTQTIKVVRHQYQDMTYTSTAASDSTWSSNFLKWYTQAAGRSVTDSTTSYTIASFANFGTNITGTNNSSYAGNLDYTSHSISRVLGANGKDFSVDQWGVNSNTTIYTIDEKDKPVVSTSLSTENFTGMKFTATRYTPTDDTTQTNTFSNLSVKYYPIYQTPVATTTSTLVNSYLTAIAGEDVRIGGGAPIFRTQNESIASLDPINVTLKFRVFNASGTEVTDNVTFAISDKQFKNGLVDIASGGNSLYNATVSSSATQTFTLPVSFDTTYWINCYAATNGYDVKIETCDCCQ